MQKKPEENSTSRVRQLRHGKAQLQHADDPFVGADMEVPAMDEDDAAGSAQNAGRG